MTLFVVEEFSPIPTLVNQEGSSTIEKLKIEVSELDVVFSTWTLRRWKGSAGIGELKALNGPKNQVLSPFHFSQYSEMQSTPNRLPALSSPAVAPCVAVYWRV